MERKKTSSQSEAGDEGSGRKPYEPPRIVYREPLEAVAVTCLPAPPSKGTPGSCPLGPVSS